jgi:hypothetical protein
VLFVVPWSLLDGWSQRARDPCSPLGPAPDHLRPAVSAVALGGLHSLAIHAKGVPVNPERRVADAARDAVLIPSGFSVVVQARNEHQRGTPWRNRRIMPVGASQLAQFRLSGRRTRRSDCPRSRSIGRGNNMLHG